MNKPAQLFRGRIAMALLGGLFSAALCWFQLVQPLDRFLYDSLNETVPLHSADDILIVAVDEASLAELGRWPWPRENHVELLRKLQNAGARAVAIDILFAEPYNGFPEVDLMLAQAMNNQGSVVLPVFIGQSGPGGTLQEMPPINPLLQSAGAVGHVHIEVDNDGVARSVFLREGLGTPRWPHFSLALATELGLHLEPLPGEYDPASYVDPDPAAIIRAHRNLIPFMGGNGTVPRLSYVDVMKGRTSPDSLRDKVVFVGATAAGHADNITTSLGQISGVEINANIFQALRTGSLISPFPAIPSVVLLFLLTALSLFFGTRLQPGMLVVAVLLMLLLLPLLSMVMLSQLRVWISSGPAMLALLLAYPLWNWLRLASALDFIHQQLVRLERENRRLGFTRKSVAPSGEKGEDPVEAVLQQLDRALRDSRFNHELIRQTFEQLTAGVILAEPPGRILLVNEEAWGPVGLENAPEDLEAVFSRLDSGQMAKLELLRETGTCEGGYLTLECRCPRTGKDFLLQGSQLALEQPLMLIVLTDISELKRSEQRRADALNFLSHDLRAPLNSVLALVQEARSTQRASLPGSFLDDIEKYIRTNLSYAENYIQLARLEHGPTRFDDCEASSLVDNAVSQLYHSSVRAGVKLVVEYEESDVWLGCSRDLVERALINLIDNALKHSGQSDQVTVSATMVGDSVTFSVRDEGPGLHKDEAERIFEQFEQGSQSRPGVGLGLRLVAAVAAAHGGSVAARNGPSGGAIFLLSIPAA